MKKNEGSYLRWTKNKIKETLNNVQFLSRKNPFSRDEYDKNKRYYEEKAQAIIDSANAWKEREKLDLKRPEDPVRIDVEMELSVVGDSMGRVFQYNGKIYRGIYPDSFEDFKTVWDTGILHALAKAHLIPEIRLTNCVSKEYALILETKRVMIQKSTVWTYAMVKDACILIAFLNTVLDHFSLTLADGHLNNVTFHMGNPLFVDIGSIIPKRDNHVLTELVFAGVYHLLFGFIGNNMMYRLRSHDDDNSNIFVYPRSYNLLAREYQMGLRAFKTYHFLHGSLFERKLLHNVFELNEFEAQDIDALFPVTREEGDVPIIRHFDAVSDFLLTLDDSKSLLTVGGTYGLIERSMLEKQGSLSVTVIDYLEHRLDLAYLELKELHRKTKVFLYNYLYITDRQVRDVAGDIVLVMDPLNDRAEFWDVEDSVKAHALLRLMKKWLAVIYLKGDDATEKFLKEHIEETMAMTQTIPLEKDNAVLWIGRKKGSGLERFNTWENQNTLVQTRVISSLRRDLIS